MCMWRKYVVGLAVVAMAVMLAGCGSSGGNEEPTPTPVPVAVVPSKPLYRVERGTVIESVNFTARIAPVVEEQLSFRADGRVAMVAVNQGDMVKKGDVLAELEISDLLNQLAQAQINLEQAQLKLRNAEAAAADQKVQLEVALETARLRLAQTKIQDPSPNVAIAAANRDKAEAAVKVAQAAYDRRGQVSGSAEALNLERATLDYEIAKAQYDLAVQKQQTWEYDIRILEQSVLLAETNLKKATVTVDPMLAQEVAKAKLALDRLNAQVANARLTAPFDGEITAVTASAGRTIQAYRVAMTLAAPGAVEVSADLLSDTMRKLSVGQKCTMTLANYPGKELRGTVRRLPYPYGTGGTATTGVTDEDQSTRITIEDAVGPLERGALVRVTVVIQRVDDALWLPPGAIRTFQGKDFVLVVDGEAQRRVPVKLGIKGEDRVEILEGVAEGQAIVGP